MNDIRSLQDIYDQLHHRMRALATEKHTTQTEAAVALAQIKLITEIRVALVPFVDAEYERLSKDEDQ